MHRCLTMRKKGFALQAISPTICTGRSLCPAALNICIMEELCSIIAMGGGGSTKLICHDGGRNIRLMVPKYPLEYINSIDNICTDKQKISDFYAEHYG